MFDEAAATEEEIWGWYVKEYENPNFIVQKLVNGFFFQINQAFSSMEDVEDYLELGCGAGESSLRLKSMLKGKSFSVSEFDQRLVNQLNKHRPELGVIQESVYDIKRQDDSMGCTILLEVMEHLDDYDKALSELFRVSKKYVLISVPNEPLWRFLNFIRGKYLKDWGNTPGHINHWSKNTLTKLVGKHGRVIKTFSPLPWIIVLAEKY